MSLQLVGGWLVGAAVILAVLFIPQVRDAIFGKIGARIYSLIVGPENAAEAKREAEIERTKLVLGAVVDLAEAAEMLPVSPLRTDALAKARRALTVIRTQAKRGQGNAIWDRLSFIDMQLSDAQPEMGQLRTWIDNLADAVRIAEGGESLLPQPERPPGTDV